MVHRDRLSDLPQSLIHHILSFLPLRDVIRTTILSKRWVDLWTTVPCLNLIITHDDDRDLIITDDDDDYCTEDERMKYVNRALILWKGIKILNFKIDILLTSDLLSLVSDLNVWTRFAVNNEVEELEIITNGNYSVPLCLYSCSSLRKLSLVNIIVRIPESPSWNQLKSLKIIVFYDFAFSGDLINRIILGSPELEVFELDMGGSHENISISSTSLKKLKIENHLYIGEDEPSLNTLRICCPKLEILEISGLFGKCLFIDISSLADVTLHFGYHIPMPARLNEFLREPLKEVLSAIQHVKKVALSDLAVQVFGASHKKYLHSPLPNVKFLELDLGHIRFVEMIDLLGIFPNLKMLVIKHEAATHPLDSNVVNYMEFESNLSSSILLQLETIEITSRLSDSSIFGFMEFLLKHAVKLEKMVLRSGGYFTSCPQNKWFEFSKKLLSIPRSSPTAKVILKN